VNIHIFGGGIGGMSAALHLGRMRPALPNGARIVIHEADRHLGGKAASQFTKAENVAHPEGARGFPGEHGFRFFPNFYRCIVDTMRHIHLTEAYKHRRGLVLKANTSFEALRATRAGGLAHRGRTIPIERSQSLSTMVDAVRKVAGEFAIEPHDAMTFSHQLLRFLTTCKERALLTWEKSTLQDFMAEHRFGDGMRQFLRSLRALSAMRASKGSLRTLLFTAVQMLYDFDPEYHLWDALLPGTTDDLLLDPWQEELDRLGVDIVLNERLLALSFANFAPGVIRASSFKIRKADGSEEQLAVAAGDIVILAVPFERARTLLLNADNRPAALAGLAEIPQRADNLGDGAEPMVGVQFWLRKDVPIVEGHIAMPNSRWAMTAVSQAQFWKSTYGNDRPLAEVFGCPGLQGILSVIVSAWDEPGREGAPSPFRSTSEQIAREAFGQLVEETGAALTWNDVLHYSVDHDIAFDGQRAFCPTPLWVSPRGSYVRRPLPDLGLKNFYIASDWARTETDVGSMEGADEAARLTVAAVAAKLGIEAEVPEVRRLRLWPELELAQRVDEWLFRKNLGPLLDMPASMIDLLLHDFARKITLADEARSVHDFDRPPAEAAPLLLSLRDVAGTREPHLIALALARGS
jgi:uncharacterized protein with NAD-binding domain and iron-sulfur cluster